MKYYVLMTALLLSGCGGSIPEEQRKKYREGMEMEKIVRATDADIMIEAMDRSHIIFDALKSANFSDSKIDSLENVHQVRINFLVPGKNNALAIEQEMIDAYVNSIALGGGNQENLQKMWIDDKKTVYDTVMYSVPKMVKRTDGVEELQGIWNVFIAKRDIVLAIGKKQK